MRCQWVRFGWLIHHLCVLHHMSCAENYLDSCRIFLPVSFLITVFSVMMREWAGRVKEIINLVKTWVLVKGSLAVVQFRKNLWRIYVTLPILLHGEEEGSGSWWLYKYSSSRKVVDRSWAGSSTGQFLPSSTSASCPSCFEIISYIVPETNLFRFFMARF